MKQLASFLQSDAFKKFTAANFKVLTNAAPIASQFQKSVQIEAYDELTRQQPKNAAAWNGLCWVTVTTSGDLDKALEQCNIAIRLNPKCPNFFDSRGLVFLKLGDFDSAIGDYDAALKLNPKMPGSLYGRGIAKIKRGDYAAGSDDITAGKNGQPQSCRAICFLRSQIDACGSAASSATPPGSCMPKTRLRRLLRRRFGGAYCDGGSACHGLTLRYVARWLENDAPYRLQLSGGGTGNPNQRILGRSDRARAVFAGNPLDPA
jgi:hypothetical protein